MKVLGIIASSLLRRISDTFTRVVSGSLGTTDSGSVWEAIRGVWYANGYQARSDDSASSYPIATVNIGQNDAVTSATVTSGTGVAFWVSDANSWWASTTTTTRTDTPYSYVCGSYSCFCFSFNFTCNNNGPTGAGGGCYNTSYISSCGALAAETSASYCGGSGLAAWSCSGNTGTCLNYCSGTSTSYEYYLRLSQSVTGTVTQSVVSDVALGAAPAAIKVTTSGDSITAQAYSDSALTTTLGSPISTTPTSPTKGTKVGIVKAPTSYNQDSAVDNFTASGA